MEINEAGEYITPDGYEVAYCSCGCGGLIPLTYNYKWKRARGEWKGFLRGHSAKMRNKILENLPMDERLDYQNGELLRDILVNKKWVTKDVLGEDFGVTAGTIYRYLAELNYTYHLFAGLRAEKAERAGKDLIVFMPGARQIDEEFTILGTLQRNFKAKSYDTRNIICESLGWGRMSKKRDSHNSQILFTLTPTKTPSIYRVLMEEVQTVIVNKDLLRTIGEEEVVNNLKELHGDGVEVKWSERM